MSKLTDIAIKKAKPRDKDYKLFHGGGLHIIVKTNGSKLWRLKYRFNGKEKLLSIGKYPTVTLKVATQKRDEAKEQLTNNIDPSQQKMLDRYNQQKSQSETFAMSADNWLESQSHFSPSYRKKVVSIIERFLKPDLQHLPMESITRSLLLNTIKKVENQKNRDGGYKIETAHKAAFTFYQIFEHWNPTDMHNPAEGIKRQLQKIPKAVNRAAITSDSKRLGEVLRMMYAYEGLPQVNAALKLAPLLLLRPGELRQGLWSQIDFEEECWLIPKDLMLKRRDKGADDHIVPLCRQAIAILQELRPITGNGQYIFPSGRNVDRPLSDNALLVALRTMGIPKDEVTIHGFRATATTMLDEKLGFDERWIEHQLHHAVKNPNGTAYNRTKFIDERRKMLQAWADYLDSLRLNDNVAFANFKAK